MPRRARQRLDRGETLIELLVSIVIMGIAVVAVVSGMTASVITSDTNRKEATATTTVHDFGEAIEALVATGTYIPGPAPYLPASFPVPFGYSTAITVKNCWVGTGWTPCTLANDSGVQQLTLQVASTDGRAVESLVIVVRKICALGPGQPVCPSCTPGQPGCT
jgi:prepilin-type N-terminal cleavage/methylation domain-containing protein